MGAAFTARGLAKRYGAVTALDGVDLDVDEGELVGLLGPNGAGKSTLVKIGCGLVRATAGEATVCGARAGSAEARRAMGYLAELFRFPGWTSADELLTLHQRLAGSAGGPNERAELLELVGLSEARGRRVEDMSKGMQQRLGIAQALVGTPRFLFLDEPTSALDPGGRRTVRGLLEELRRRGVAVLLNSHLLSEIELVCDRVVILARGKIVAEGRPSELARASRHRGRRRRRHAALRGSLPGGRPADRRRPRRGRRARLRRPRARDARSRRSTSRRSGTTPDERRRGHRRVRPPREPPPAGLPRRPRAHRGVRRPLLARRREGLRHGRRERTASRRRHWRESTPARSPGRRSSGSRCSGRCSWAPSSRPS